MVLFVVDPSLIFVASLTQNWYVTEQCLFRVVSLLVFEVLDRLNSILLEPITGDDTPW